MAELINGLGGEQGFGENFLDRNDDESTEAIDITSVFDGPLNFFGNEFEELWVNNNGNITFNDSLSQFTPDGITSETNNPLITPYWADVDTSSSEELDPTPGGNSIGSNLVYYDLDEANNTFTATWDDVGYFSSNTDKLNAFQLQLIGQGNGDFDIVFRYEDINWTTGNASGGENGLGGEVARGGFSAGDGENFFELSQSGNEQAMLNLEETTGNTGETGLFRFEVRNGESNVSPVLTTSSIGVEEGDSGVTEATFAVELLEAIEEEVTVDYATTGGTATAGEDYEETTGTLTFAAGETAKTITISVNGDEEIEPNEDVILELSNLSDNAEFPFDNDTFSKILTIQDDEIIPNPPTRGNSWGDPHLVTFDGNSYDFQAVGEFILTQSNNSDFEVQVRQEPLEDRDDVSINTAVATQLGEETVGLYTNREQPLVIDDTETELANGESLELGNGEIFRTNENRYTVVNAGEDGEVNAGDSQLVATVYDNHIDVEVYIADVNQGGTTGLLGNFNGDPSDDLAIRDGETLEQP
ncbi:MAG: nidogen-like domain-containing protein, partial [Halothece sp.]